MIKCNISSSSSSLSSSFTKVKLSLPSLSLNKNYNIDKIIFIKRDDQYNLIDDNININGNKSRKFYKLHQQLSLSSSLSSSSLIKDIKSFGGIQSNSMLAIAAITSYHKCKFTYYTKKINNNLKYKGNYDLAIKKYGMNHVELSNLEYDNINELSNLKNDNNTLWIPQGGAYSDAKYGIYKLIDEIVDFIKNQKDKDKIKTKWKIIFSCGTGTTSLFAAQSLNKLLNINNNNNDYNIEIIAIPCVGSKEYLIEQMNKLNSISDNNKIFPTILYDDNNDKKRVFAKPYTEHYNIWYEMYQQTNILFDLLYFPRAFEILLNNEEYWYDENIQMVYYHCGGLEGNDSQLDRYKYLKII